MAARVFFLFTLGYCLSYFYRSANAVLAKDLSQDLGLGPAELGLLLALNDDPRQGNGQASQNG